MNKIFFSLCLCFYKNIPAEGAGIFFLISKLIQYFNPDIFKPYIIAMIL